MTLNDIFRRSGEPTYYTPIEVLADVLTPDESATIINPPYTTTI